MTPKRPLALIVLDGWGLAPPGPANAVALAPTPIFDNVWQTRPHTALEASGLAVGLPQGQMGNSEVGHTNLGAGRVVYQPSTRISAEIESRSFYDNAVLIAAMEKAKKSRLHLMGLVSNGGVHSRLDHLFALLELAEEQGVRRVYVHAFTDGRDTMPTSGREHIKTLEEKLRAHRFEVGAVATVTGRYWVMDRDRRWERTQRAYRALVAGEGARWDDSAASAVADAYGHGQTDEFIEPIVLRPDGALRDGDVVMFFNFRPDRARQLAHALHDPAFDGFSRGCAPDLALVTLTQYEASLDVPVAYPPRQHLPHIFGEVVSEAGFSQFRCAETEKYAHVTYFFNNGREEPFPDEVRHLIPSPKVTTYDLKPEMSVAEVARTAAERIAETNDAFVLVNFANPDMVGHTGVLEAAVAAVAATDRALGVVLQALAARGGQALVLADHGNAECMVNADGSPHTAHTTNPVPLVYIGHERIELISGGKLGDVAPTALRLLGIDIPEEMGGRCLIKV